ncbi:MAG: hypothetical protein H6813_07330 [Phycisphaeraceae bacterium]|nr:hypothetical protein [Phycisphaeraceae bacterium]MCB9848307.1 hypothetical protein [Phycisphaeraceae bacterium]
MLAVNFSMVAENAIINASTGSLSVIEILEHIATPSFPLTIPRLNVIGSMVRQESDDKTQSIELICDYEGRDEIYRTRQVVDFGENLSTIAIATIWGLRIPRPGNITFKIAAPDTNDVLSTYELRLSEAKLSPTVP